MCVCCCCSVFRLEGSVSLSLADRRAILLLPTIIATCIFSLVYAVAFLFHRLKKKKNWRKTALSLCRKKKWFHTQTHNKRLRAVCGCIIHPLFHLSSFVFSLLHRKCHSLPLSIVCQIWTRATKEEGKKWKIIYTYKYT